MLNYAFEVRLGPTSSNPYLRILGPGGIQEALREAPEGEASAVGHMGKQTPMDTDDGGHIQFGPQLNTVLETYTAPE